MAHEKYIMDQQLLQPATVDPLKIGIRCIRFLNFI